MFLLLSQGGEGCTRLQETRREPAPRSDRGHGGEGSGLRGSRSPAQGPRSGGEREEEEGEIKDKAKDSGLGDWDAGHWPREHARAGSLGDTGEVLGV